MSEPAENPTEADVATGTGGEENPSSQQTREGRDAYAAGRDQVIYQTVSSYYHSPSGLLTEWIERLSSDSETKDRVLELVRQEQEIEKQEVRSRRRSDALSTVASVVGLNAGYAATVILFVTLHNWLGSVVLVVGGLVIGSVGTQMIIRLTRKWSVMRDKRDG